MTSHYLMDRKISIMRASYSVDALNTKVATWSEFIEVWAGQRDVSDGERLKMAEVQGEITTRFHIRWSTEAATIDTRDRVATADGRMFDIFSVKELGRREVIEITGTARSEK